MRTEEIDVAVFHQAKLGNFESGDAYFIHAEEEYFLCAIADGLGNGPLAKQSAEIIPYILARYHMESIEELLHRCNEYMIQKRGAAVAIVKVDYQTRKIQYSCIGNIRCYIYQHEEKLLYPLPVTGYLSGKRIHPKVRQYTYTEGDLFLLHSDGVNLRSPSSILKKSRSVYELYNYVLQEQLADDDATFIAGNLLR